MRVKLYSVIMLAVVTFTACSNEEMGETETPRGLTLSASVENLSTRASMTDESGTWKFAFETDDKVSVSNNKINDIYTFQKVSGGHLPVQMPWLLTRLPTGMLIFQAMMWT